MLLIERMKDAAHDQHHTHNNDNEPLPFETLAAATARALENLAEKKNGRDDTGDGEQDRKSHPEQKREYVDHGLRQIRAFEDQAAGKWRRPRRGGPGIWLGRDRADRR